MPAYPLLLTELDCVRVVVIGGGAVAERKVVGLIEGGAYPHVISPRLTSRLHALEQAGALAWLPRVYVEGDLIGAALALAATDDRAVNACVAAEARQLGILLNVADAPKEGNFTTTATVRRGDLVLAVTTCGASPALAATIRRELEAQYGPEYALLLAELRELRDGR
ncbi:MAG: bifunctional precorrin-2 dehydrogenase/sirohydrochlorin ferrochelatase [Roseiflexaceae bacterium]|nr:bifunctional precorrin-2 dehydrogenase/sirohydrochlorin ferrochelatase [Roseiflexaceae bacterium]